MEENIFIPKGAIISRGATEASLVSIGELKGSSELSLTYDEVDVQGSTGAEVVHFFKNIKPVLKGTMYQMDFGVINEMNSGLFVKTSVAAAEVPGAEIEYLDDEWDYLVDIPLEQNATGLSPTITSVTAQDDGVLTLDEDYIVKQNDLGDWVIVMIESATLSGGSGTTQGLTIVYTYTPAASDTYAISKGAKTLTGKVWQIEYPGDEVNIKIRLYSAVQNNGLTFTFLAESEADANSFAFELTGSARTTDNKIMDIIRTPVVA